MIGGKAYVANTGSNYAMLNGKAVVYGAEATDKVPHNFSVEKNVAFDTKGNPVSVTCDTCKKTFKVVKADKVPSDYAGDIQSVTNNAKLAGYVVLLGTTATSTGSTSTTTSPKTFDAGIAMYVGMALTSVAGSAVVIGKKKEF